MPSANIRSCPQLKFLHSEPQRRTWIKRILYLSQRTNCSASCLQQSSADLVQHWKSQFVQECQEGTRRRFSTWCCFEVNGVHNRYTYLTPQTSSFKTRASDALFVHLQSCLAIHLSELLARFLSPSVRKVGLKPTAH